MQQEAKTLQEIESILALVRYKPGWQLRVIEKTSDVVLCQWVFKALDVDDDGPNAVPTQQFCRKWFISLYSTDSEVIRTAYLAVVQAEMHEINEKFTYNGVRLFDPHTDLNDLAQHMKTAHKDVRR
jgi:hypothetical protein